ncbi:hypothetical protein J2T13_003655 [Paenibacillus sp. DS2015]|uniref:hypothetical protein n=1 Tax=Paenibacillus sp. DS2015 TaxID=3373917 RepID=UPI003D251F84
MITNQTAAKVEKLICELCDTIEHSKYQPARVECIARLIESLNESDPYTSTYVVGFGVGGSDSREDDEE